MHTTDHRPHPTQNYQILHRNEHPQIIVFCARCRKPQPVTDHAWIDDHYTELRARLNHAGRGGWISLDQLEHRLDQVEQARQYAHHIIQQQTGAVV